MAAPAGTYDCIEVKIDVDHNGATSNSMAGAGISETVVLDEDGTGHADLSHSYRQPAFNAVITGDKTLQNSFFDTPSAESVDITWSLADGSVTIPQAGSFRVVRNLLIDGIVNEEGHDGITVLARR